MLMQERNGDLVVSIAQPWRSYRRPSVEVCLLPGDWPENSKLHPLYFVKQTLKGEVTVAVYHCQDRADGVPQRTSLKEHDLEFELFGQRNALGKAAVCVACRTETPDHKLLPRAVYCLPEYWASEDGVLYLSLPKDYFGASGKLVVWLLREDSVVWSDTIRWPGIPDAEPAPTAKPGPKPDQPKNGAAEANAAPPKPEHRAAPPAERKPKPKKGKHAAEEEPGEEK
jgi:hypothetical protein